MLFELLIEFTMPGKELNETKSLKSIEEFELFLIEFDLKSIFLLYFSFNNSLIISYCIEHIAFKRILSSKKIIFVIIGFPNEALDFISFNKVIYNTKAYKNEALKGKINLRRSFVFIKIKFYYN